MHEAHDLDIERERLARRAMIVGSAAAVLIALAGLTRSRPAQLRFLALYIAPTVAAFGLWVRDRILHGDRATAFDATAFDATPAASMISGVAAFGAGSLLSFLTPLDIAVVGLAALRTVTGLLPFSGHMLFFTYSLAARSRLYRVAALAILLETTWFKLVIWRDPLSWSVGLALGALALIVRWSIARRAHRRGEV